MFPTSTSAESFTADPAVSLFSHVLVGHIELRIVDAVLFFNSTYGINPPVYEIVPGFIQPRQRFTYGVRWQFWN